MKFQPSPHREEIIQALKQGMPPDEVAQRFGVSLKTAQRYEKQAKSGAAEKPTEQEAAIRVKPGKVTVKYESRVSLADTPPQEILNQVRGTLRLELVQKVTTIPTPELLYTGMVISQQEWGWPSMPPQDFIDTVLDKFIRATGIEVNAYLKTGELEKLAKFARDHGYFGKPEEEDHDSSKSARPDSEEGRVGARAAAA